MINFSKSQPSPVCLTQQMKGAGVNYRCGDVIIRLKADFCNKCYLCEEVAPSTINVEHFVPHRGDRSLMLDWNNLFYSCGHCNNTKLADPRYDDILNCTDNRMIILNVLRFDIKPFPKEKVSVVPLVADPAVVNTAELLNKIYNGTTALKMTEGVNIRDKLIKELIQFNNILAEYYYESGLTSSDKLNLKTAIRRHISSDAPFTAFKVWILKANDCMRIEFSDLLS